MPYSFASPRHDQERQAGRKRGRRCERNRAELRAGQPRGPGLRLGHRGGKPHAERLEQVGDGLEAVLVEVVPGALAGAKDEVPLEVGMLAQGGDELRVVH